ncbi:glutathione S-transferase family protein [Rahnella sp. PAMC25617]|uniref:glutathione S-transferase family protein n=1 Tax=Rahnella TaxID=34037 RepID=UPI00101BE7E5|nr:glutathione S-transferase family protein [Rahnella variigena]MDH2897282.1 glutathione S-transferase family protein [Rahnella variigena]RYJ12313.1 glutathione S-transferase [Rahnella variigena]
MLTLWGRENSSNVKKVLWLLDELNVTFQHINAGGVYGKNNEPLYLSLNPNGLVPCLQDDDFVLWESNAILRYLAERSGEEAFWPDNLQQRAAADKWLDWCSNSLTVPFRQVFLTLVRTPEAERDMSVVAAGMAAFEKYWAIADAVLAKQKWFSGEQFGIGDIPVACYADTWFRLDIERQAHPNLERWYQQLQQRPAFCKRVMLPLS